LVLEYWEPYFLLIPNVGLLGKRELKMMGILHENAPIKDGLLGLVFVFFPWFPFYLVMYFRSEYAVNLEAYLVDPISEFF